MIEFSQRLAYNCAVIIPDETALIISEIKTDGNHLFAVESKTVVLTEQLYNTVMKGTSNDCAIVCNRINKIMDNCYIIDKHDVQYINIKLFHYMNQWNTHYLHLIKDVPVYQEQ